MASRGPGKNAHLEYVDPDDVLEEHSLDGGVDTASVTSSSYLDDADVAHESVCSGSAGRDGEDADVVAEASGPDTSLLAYTGHTSSVFSVAACATAARVLIASGGADDCAHLWVPKRAGVSAPAVRAGDAASRDGIAADKACECVAVLRGHTDTVNSVAFNHTGRWLATGSLDGTVRIWDTAATPTTCTHTLEGPSGDIEWLAWHARGDVLLAGSADATAWMWHVTETAADCMCVFAGHEDGVSCGTFTGTGKAVITAGRDASLRVWNPKTGACVHTFSGHGFHEDEINTLACSPDKPLVLTGSQDGTAKLANFSTGKVLGTFAHPNLPPETLGESASAAGAAGGTSAPAGEDSEEVDVHPSVEAVAFCPVLPLIVTGATDGSLIVWDMHTCEKRRTLSHDDSIIRVMFLPDSPLAVATTAAGTVHIWDVRDGRSVAIYTGHAGMVFEAAVVRPPPGADVDAALPATWIVTAGDDHTCRIFSATF